VHRGTFGSNGRLAVLLLLGLLTTNVWTTAPLQAAGSVSALELRRLFPGSLPGNRAGIFENPHHRVGRLFTVCAANGKSDRGVWAIRADRLCIRFTKWLKGRTRCSKVTEQAGWYSTSDVKFKKVAD
jgi:hypothetical protein